VHYGRLANELCERTHEGGAAGDLDGFLAPAGPSNPLVDDRGKAVAGYTEPRLWCVKAPLLPHAGRPPRSLPFPGTK